VSGSNQNNHEKKVTENKNKNLSSKRHYYKIEKGFEKGERGGESFPHEKKITSEWTESRYGPSPSREKGTCPRELHADRNNSTVRASLVKAKSQKTKPTGSGQQTRRSATFENQFGDGSQIPQPFKRKEGNDRPSSAKERKDKLDLCLAIKSCKIK